MSRKILIAALLCLALCQTANAQYPTLMDAICNTSIDSSQFGVSGLLVTIQPTSVEIYFHATGFAYDDGASYHLLGFTACIYFPTYDILGIAPLYYCYKHDINGWSQVTKFPMNYSGTLVDMLVFPLTEERYVDRYSPYMALYYLSYSDVCSWFFGYNSLIARLPQTRSDCVVAYDLPLSATGSFVLFATASAPRNELLLTLDTDGGGVPDWFELMGKPHSYTDVNNSSDDVLCSCGACCSCTCVCGEYVPFGCSVTPALPALSENAPPLLRALLFFLCMCCGAGLFGCFMDSFEKGSF